MQVSVNRLIATGSLCLYFLISHAWGQGHSAFQVVVDHEKSFIRIEASFYAKHNTPIEHSMLAEGINYWNARSGQYAYVLPDGGCYAVQFALTAAQGDYLDNGFFLPASNENHRLLNPVEIMPAAKLRHISSRTEGHAAGYSPNSAIYISRRHADNLAVWVHEIGHRIGAGHHAGHGIMAATLSEGELPEVSRATIKELLGYAGIEGLRTSAHHHADIRPAAVVHQGHAPNGFASDGKLKKQSAAQPLCPSALMADLVTDASAWP